jgi:hypothetical protein
MTIIYAPCAYIVTVSTIIFGQLGLRLILVVANMLLLRSNVRVVSNCIFWVDATIYVIYKHMNKKDQNMNEKVDENTSTITGDCAILAQK